MYIRAVYRNFAKGGGGEFGVWTKEGAPGGSSVLSCEMLHSGQCYRVRCYTLVSVIV